MSVKLPSVFGDFDIGSESNSEDERITASGFTDTTVRQKRSRTEKFPEYVEPKFKSNDVTELAEMIRSLNSKICDLETVVGDSGKLASRTRRIDSVIDDSATRITQKIRGLNLGTKSTIVPNDSVSNYGAQQAHQSNQINDNETFTQSVSSKTGSLYDNVIGGFAQTPDEKIEELEALTKIRKIYGLPQIFVNERLNFLIHLHKPLMNLLADGDKYPSEETLYRIDDFMRRRANKVRTQHEDLLYSVIETTVRRGKIRSNPHNLPILEIGMSLTDKIAFLCFSALYKEFQNEWFQSMKDIDAPKFHNTYQNFRTSRPSVKQNFSQRNSKDKKARNGGSIISFF